VPPKPPEATPQQPNLLVIMGERAIRRVASSSCARPAKLWPTRTNGSSAPCAAPV